MRWKKLAANIMRSNFNSLALPYKALLVVTKQCHSKCQNCNIWQRTPENELSLEEFKEIAAQSPFLQWLNITGGEPTDRPDLPEIVDAFLRNCPELIFVNFATNGLNPDKIEGAAKRIQTLKPPRFVITVSIDGPRDTNDKLRGIKGDFARATETYSRLRKLGIETYIGMTLYPENYYLVDETVQAINHEVGNFSHRDMHINIAHSSPHYFENKSKQSADDTKTVAAIEAYIRARGFPLRPFEWVERAYLKKVKKYLGTGKSPVSCSALRSSVYISEHGIVHPCSIWEKPLGSLRESGYSLVPILQSTASATAKKVIKREQCPGCWTPCEAYPSLAANLFSSLKTLFN